MTAEALAPVTAGLGIGVALAGAPGPVQAVLLAEAIRGGVGRGLRAWVGVHVTFGLLLACLGLGLSVATPSGAGLRILQLTGGVLLLWLAVDGLRSRHGPGPAESEAGRRVLPPAARGALAILLNPGGWLFLAAVASPLLATATRRAGVWSALAVAAALVTGAAIGDVVVVALGGVAVRRAGERVERWVRRVLALVLAGLGVWLVASAVTS